MTSSGVITSPGPNTIVEFWQYEKQKKEATADWHLLVRQKIIGLVSNLPSQLSADELQKLNLPPQLSADELHKLTSQKLATIAVKWITMHSPHGPDPDLPIDALLAELDQTAEKQHVRSSIRRAIVERQNQVDGELLLAGLQMDDAMHNRS